MHFYNWMQTSINQLYEQIKDIKTKKKFEEEISRRQKEYDGLLNKETAALLIVDELGKEQLATIIPYGGIRFFKTYFKAVKKSNKTSNMFSDKMTKYILAKI